MGATYPSPITCPSLRVQSASLCPIVPPLEIRGVPGSTVDCAVARAASARTARYRITEVFVDDVVFAMGQAFGWLSRVEKKEQK
jgi:hypothetical protein